MSAPAHHSMFSELWHRAAVLRPRLKPETLVERHVVRGQAWYVVSDRFSTHTYRFTPAIYAILARMDGRRTLDGIWSDVARQFGREAPAQDQVLQAVSQLYAAELIQSDRPVDEAEITERAEARARRISVQRYSNPMFVRLPLLDPDRFLSATAHLVRPFCGVLGGLLWLAAIVWLAAEAGLHWRELSGDVSDRVLAADSLVVFLLVFPVLKILHELGHAYAVKLLGGAVHEVGVSLITFMPAPYVDASASALFPSRWQRALVGAAGMMAELAAAAVAMAVWLHAEPGLVRSVAYDVLFIAGVSTIVFNANPLLRFDGYYIVSDLLGLPNLAMRAQRFYLTFTQRHLFGMAHVPPVETAPGERFWLVLYAPASLAYRIVVVVGIALFVGDRYFFVGVALVAWMVVTTFVWPLLKGLSFVVMSPAVAGRRVRAVALTGGSLAALLAAVAFVPIPHGTVAPGVVWIPEEAHVVTQTPGRVVRLVARPESRVEAGDPLVELEDPYIGAKRASLEGRLAELEARLTAAEPTSPYDMQLLRQQVSFAKDELAETLRRQRALTVRSASGGLFVVPRPEDLQGTFLKQGQLVGYVMASPVPVVRAAIASEDIDLVRTDTRSVSVRLEGAIHDPIDQARIAREVPSATRRLPSRALSTQNGGDFVLDPADKEGDTAILPFFTIDVSVASGLARDRWGGRAHLRFDHGSSPLLGRWARALRQVFLGHFRV